VDAHEALAPSKAFSLCGTLDEARALRDEVAFMQAVVSESVVDIFDAVGLERPNIGLLNDEIKSKFASNLVQQKKFSEMLGSVITRYQNRSIETAQVMEELIEMARRFREAASRGEALGLTEDEVRFYDALADNESAVRELTDETLKKIAHELTENLRKYKYPPDMAEAAVELVLAQAEALGEEWAPSMSQ